MGKNENEDPGRVKDEKRWRTYRTGVEVRKDYVPRG